jgi:hypothetical protein
VEPARHAPARGGARRPGRRGGTPEPSSRSRGARAGPGWPRRGRSRGCSRPAARAPRRAGRRCSR